jgi:hypothetical protein
MRNSQSGPLIAVKQGKIASGSTINAHAAGQIQLGFPGIKPNDIVKVTGTGTGEWTHFAAFPVIDGNVQDTVVVYVWNMTAGNITLAADLSLSVSVEPRG